MASMQDSLLKNTSLKKLYHIISSIVPIVQFRFFLYGSTLASALRSNISHRLRHPTRHRPLPHDLEIDSGEITQPETKAKRNTVLNYEDGEENGNESYEEVMEEGENDKTDNLTILNPVLLIMNDEGVIAEKMGEDLIDHQFGGELIGE
ncbi:hypothetical protein LguiA_021001 [Lonicera macranthoides]